MISTNRLAAIAVAGLLAFSFSVESIAQDLRASLFRDTDTLIAQAEAANAPLLSPSEYKAAMDRYSRAESMLSKDKSIESIREELGKAGTYLRQSIENSELAKVTFASQINARNAAVAAQADTFASEEWQDAEAAFEIAARGLEGGDVKRAQTRAAKAGPMYLNAELVAIQAAILGEARSLIAAAQKEKVGKSAPATLAKAEQLAAQAAQLVVENRYDTGPAIKLAAEAEYEAKHASYLAEQVLRLKDKEVSPEGLVLEWERPLAQVAAALETSTDFSRGFTVPTEAMLSRVAVNAETIKSQGDELTFLTSRVTELEEKLGVTTKRAEASELRRQQVAALEQKFGPDEARILQESGKIIIRLVGLQFATGQAVIESKYFALLRKLDEVPDVFPGAKLVVEGHTDSQGNDTSNLALSERRANSVRDYLLAATSLKSSGISAVGYGESRPIANNEDAAARARNRRTDVIIIPAD